MTRLVLAFVVLATFVSCAPRVMPPTSFHYFRVAEWKVCFDTESGVRVYAVEPATCPDALGRQAFETGLTRTLQRMGGEVSDIFGARYVFVPTEIADGGAEVPAISDIDDTKTDILIWQHRGDWWQVRHETGHVLHYKRYPYKDGDPMHKDCAFWRRLENRNCGIWERRR